MNNSNNNNMKSIFVLFRDTGKALVLSLWKTRICVTYIVNTIALDEPVGKGASLSAAMVLA